MNSIQCFNAANTSIYFNNASMNNFFDISKIVEPNIQSQSFNNRCGRYDNIEIEGKEGKRCTEIDKLSKSDEIGTSVAKIFIDLCRYFGLKRYCTWSNKRACALVLATNPETVQFLSKAYSHNILDSIDVIKNGIFDDGYKLMTPVLAGNYHFPKVLDSAFQTYLDIRARLD
jgi:hypothetical protein